MQTSSLASWPMALAVIAIALIASYAAYLIGCIAGIRRGRAQERMRLPEHGALHFRDGPMRTVEGSSPERVVEKLIGGRR